MPELVGTIIAYGGVIDLTKLPGWEATRDWMLCDGRELAIRDYPALHDAIRVTWGGDEKAGKFRLPDLRGYFLRGVDAFGDHAMDPDAEERFARYPGGNIRRQVGSFQRWGTALPLASPPGSLTQTHFSITATGSGHVHSLRFQLNATRGVFDEEPTTVAFPGVHDPIGTNDPFVRDRGYGDLGEHTHGITGGNRETRPVNAYVHWLIRYRVT